MSEQAHFINFYPGFEPRQSNWSDWQQARIDAENSKWNLTKQAGVVPNSGFLGAPPFVFSVNMATGQFTISAGVVFNAVGDRLEIPSGVVPGGDGTVYNALATTLQDFQSPPQSLAASPGSLNIPILKNTAGAFIDTYVFIQYLDTIDQTATNRFLPNRPWQYPKHDLGYKFLFYSDENAAAAAIGLPDAVFIGAIRILNGAFSVINEFTVGQPPALVQTYQVPVLLGSDDRDVVGGDSHAHEGPYLRGLMYLETANTVVRIRLVEDASPTNYVDYFISDGLTNANVIANSAAYTVGGTGFSSGQQVEFAVPAGTFPFLNPAVRKLRVQLSNTGYFLFPDATTGALGTRNDKLGLTSTQQEALHRVFWADLRIESSKDQPSNEETLYLPNSSFEMPATATGLTAGAVGAVVPLTKLPTNGAVDCSIPGWSNSSALNLMALLQVSTISPAPSLPGAGLFVLCTYSTAIADFQSTATGLSNSNTAAGGYGTSPTDTKYVLVTLPESGDPEFASQQQEASKDFDNRKAGSIGAYGVNVPSSVVLTDTLPLVQSLLVSRGAGTSLSSVNKWANIKTHFQRLWARFLEHDHSAGTGVQQVVTNGIAAGAVTLPLLAPALTTPAPGVAGLVPPNLVCISLTGVCPQGWTPVGVPGSFLLLAPGALPVQNASASNGLTPVSNITVPSQLLGSVTISPVNHSHPIVSGSPLIPPVPHFLGRASNSDLVDTASLIATNNFAKEDHSHSGDTSPAGGFTNSHTHPVPVYTVTLCQK